MHPVGFEPTHLAALEPESSVYANFTTGASCGVVYQKPPPSVNPPPPPCCGIGHSGSLGCTQEREFICHRKTLPARLREAARIDILLLSRNAEERAVGGRKCRPLLKRHTRRLCTAFEFLLFGELTEVFGIRALQIIHRAVGIRHHSLILSPNPFIAHISSLHIYPYTSFALKEVPILLLPDSSPPWHSSPDLYFSCPELYQAQLRIVNLNARDKFMFCLRPLLFLLFYLLKYTSTQSQLRFLRNSVSRQSSCGLLQSNVPSAKYGRLLAPWHIPSHHPTSLSSTALVTRRAKRRSSRPGIRTAAR